MSTPELDVELWHCLETMQLDDAGAALTFTARLARDNGWTRAHVNGGPCRSSRHAVRCGGPGVASASALHAHYWHTLCEDILHFDLHHEPTLGGKAEHSKFVNWYACTLNTASGATAPYSAHR